MNAIGKFLNSGMNFILRELYINQKLPWAREFQILILCGRSPIKYFYILSLTLFYCLAVCQTDGWDFYLF